MDAKNAGNIGRFLNVSIFFYVPQNAIIVTRFKKIHEKLQQPLIFYAVQLLL